MSDKSAIEWTEATWNPLVGCAVVSPGCTNCYAMQLAGTRLDHTPRYGGLTHKTKAGPVWNGQVRMVEEVLLQPLRWKRPRMIFVNSMSDLFHESVPDEWIDKVFAAMTLAPQHTFQVLTKRSERMRSYLADRDAVYERVHDTIFYDSALRKARGFDVDAVVANLNAWLNEKGYLSNVWLGVSAEDQARADERIPDLLDTPAAVRWVSAEPLLGPIDFTHLDEDVDDFKDCGGHPDPHWPLDSVDATWLDALQGRYICEARNPQGQHLGFCDSGLRTKFNKGLDWIVVGGESGPKARPMHPDWARSIRDQCAAAGVPFFFKQWGSWAPAPWKLERQQDETDEAYKARSEARGATHAVAPWGQLNELSHRPWSIERASTGKPHAGLRLTGKKAAGRLLDECTHDAMPEHVP